MMHAAILKRQWNLQWGLAPSEKPPPLSDTSPPPSTPTQVQAKSYKSRWPSMQQLNSLPRSDSPKSLEDCLDRPATRRLTRLSLSRVSLSDDTKAAICTITNNEVGGTNQPKPSALHICSFFMGSLVGSAYETATGNDL
eukprot:1195445-Prorocentrum_minimum.AAC.1